MSKLTKAAEGQSCVRCQKEDGTTVSCHYSGPYQHRFGKGRAIKGSDEAAADLCLACHCYFDEYRGIPDADGSPEREAEIKLARAERSEEFLAMCLLTVIRRQQEGVIAA